MAAKTKVAATTATPAETEWTGKTQIGPDQRKGHLERRKTEDGTYVTSWVPNPSRGKA